MNFTLLRQQLLDHYDNVIEVRRLLKETIGAQYVDILFWNDEQQIFFDKINHVTLNTQFLDQSSLIGSAYKDQKAHFITQLSRHPHYNLALDNPFKVEMENQIILPTLYHGRIIGFLRCSHVPHGFTTQDFEGLKILHEPLIKIFTQSKESDISPNKDLIAQRMRLFRTINEIKHLFDDLAVHTNNQEVEKLIHIGKQNLDHIFTYLNPSLQHVAMIKRELQQFKNDVTQKFNVLIADDIRINVQILNAMLSDDTHIEKIKVAYDGIETLHVLEKSTDPIDILFLDHHMPGVLGTDIARRLKEEEKKQIVIVSITNDAAVLEQHRNLYDFAISKPFIKDKVKEIVSTIKSKKLS